MKTKIFLFLFVFSLFSDEPERFVNLEENAQDFVLEIKKLEIPGYPIAFNPSIIPWGDRFLMNFRNIPDRRQPFTSYIGLVILDQNFNPISEPQLLDMRGATNPAPSRCEDGRFIYVGDKLYLVYSDNPEPKISKGGFRMYVAEVEYDGALFRLKTPECLSRYEGESREIREKSWVPFDYKGNLLLGYSLVPHLIFRPLLDGTGQCETVASTIGSIAWDWGILRGGTAALLGVTDNGDYLSFFHSSKKMATTHSEGQHILHYFIGAYTFSPEPPFGITKISPTPIIGKNFYEGPVHKHYWHRLRVVFPGGYFFDENFIWMAYGRQDHEIWIAKLDRRKLLESLVPVTSTSLR